jgi:hypothetical protein
MRAYFLTFKFRPRVNCSGWSLAFEVELKMVPHDKLSGATPWNEKFKSSHLYSEYGHDESCIFHHLILDFNGLSVFRMPCFNQLTNASGATFCEELSRLPGTATMPIRARAIAMKNAVEHVKAYLRQLALHGHHVLHSSPVFSEHSAVGITSIDFDVTSPIDITPSNCSDSTEAPVLLVFGMYGSRTMPVAPVDWTCAWPMRGGYATSSGMVAVSNDVFREAYVLPTVLREFEAVGRKTTIVPVCPEDSPEEWAYGPLTTWDKLDRMGRKSWKSVRTEDSDHLKFVWEYKGVLSHRDSFSGQHIDENESNIECQSACLSTLSIANRSSLVRQHSE